MCLPVVFRVCFGTVLMCPFHVCHDTRAVPVTVSVRIVRVCFCVCVCVVKTQPSVGALMSKCILLSLLLGFM